MGCTHVRTWIWQWESRRINPRWAWPVPSSTDSKPGFSNPCQDSENPLLNQARVGFYCWQTKTVSDTSLSWTHLHWMPGWFSWLIFPTSSHRLLFDFNASYSCTGEKKMYSLLPVTKVELTWLLKIILIKADHMEIRKIELFSTWSTGGPRPKCPPVPRFNPGLTLFISGCGRNWSWLLVWAFYKR